MAINLGSAVAYLELDTSKFSKGFSSAFNDLKLFEDKTATTEQKLGGLQSAFTTTGGMLSTTVTLPLVGIGIASGKTAIDFEQGMAKVKAISGATGEDFEALKDKAKEMGAKTKFSATESADAFNYMAMAGWKTKDMLDGIEGIMNLAAASGEDLALTSDIVTDALTGFGLSAKDSAHFADILAKASSNSNTNVAMMGETFKYVAPVAGALGYTAEDTALAVGLMANSGIKASQAGTSLRGALTKLIKPSKDAQAIMDEYDFSLRNTDGSMKSLRGVMDMFRSTLGDMDEGTQTYIATQLFGQEAMSGMLAIINASDEDYNKLAESIDNCDGASLEMANTMMDTTEGALTVLKSTLESVAITIGEYLTPYIRKLSEWITGLLEKFNSLSEEQKDQVVKWGLIVAAIGPVLLILGKLFGTLSTIVGVVSRLKIVMSSSFLSAVAPISALVAAVGLAVGAFVTLLKTNEDFKRNITDSINSVKQTFEDFSQRFVDKINELGFEFENITDVLGTAWMAFCDIVAPYFEATFEVLAEWIDALAEGILAIVDVIVSAFNGDWSGVLDGLESFAEQAIGFVGSFVETIAGMFVELMARILEALGFDKAAEQIRKAFDAVVEFASNIPEKISQFVDDVKTFFTVKIPEIFTNFVEVTLPEKIEAIKTWFSELPRKLGEVVGEMIGHVFNWGVEFGEWIDTELPGYIDALVEWFKGLPGKIWTWLTETFDKIKQWGSDVKDKAEEIGRDFSKNFKKFIKELPDKVKELLDKVPEKIEEIGTDMKEAGKKILNKLWDGIKEVGEDISRWFSDFATSIGGFVRGIVDGFQSVVSGANDAKSAASSVKTGTGKREGSFANGLTYVPYDGYRAELHKGERVLTKDENEEYNEGKGSGDTYNFYNTKPDPYEYGRQMKRVKEELEEE